MSQKELAAKIRKDNGDPISPQYLNDIERDRRTPSSAHLISEFAKALGLSAEYLHFLAGQLPEDLKGEDYAPARVEEAMRAFRRSLKG